MFLSYFSEQFVMIVSLMANEDHTFQHVINVCSLKPTSAKCVILRFAYGQTWYQSTTLHVKLLHAFIWYMYVHINSVCKPVPTQFKCKHGKHVLSPLVQIIKVIAADKCTNAQLLWEH